MSKTKSGGSTRNGRDSAAKRLGPKVFDGQVVTGRFCDRAATRHPHSPRRQRGQGWRRHAIRQGRWRRQIWLRAGADAW